MTMSPAESSGASAFTVDSVASPAGTITQTARGAASVDDQRFEGGRAVGARGLGAGHSLRAAVVGDHLCGRRARGASPC